MVPLRAATPGAFVGLAILKKSTEPSLPDGNGNPQLPFPLFEAVDIQHPPKKNVYTL